MSVQPAAWPEPDPQIAAAIAAKYRGKRPRPLAVLVRDQLGQWRGGEGRGAGGGEARRPPPRGRRGGGGDEGGGPRGGGGGGGAGGAGGRASCGVGAGGLGGGLCPPVRRPDDLLAAPGQPGQAR